MRDNPFLLAVCIALAIVVVTLSLAPPIHQNNPPREYGSEYSKEKKQNPSTNNQIVPPVDIQCDPDCATQNTDDERYPSYAAWLLHKAINEPIVGFTGILAVATIFLVIIAAIQIKDARILQRAYISAEIRGIRPYIGDETKIVAWVDFVNVGKLPARDVTFRRPNFIWCDKELTESSLQVSKAKPMKIVMSPGSKMRIGTDERTLVEMIPTKDIATC